MKCITWYHLSPEQWIILLILIALADVFTITQRYVIPEMLRPLAYVVFVIVLLLWFFFIVRPKEPMILAQTLTVILGTITIVLILVQDVILTSNLSWKTVVIFMGAIFAPVIAAYLFRAIRGSEPTT